MGRSEIGCRLSQCCAVASLKQMTAGPGRGGKDINSSVEVSKRVLQQPACTCTQATLAQQTAASAACIHAARHVNSTLTMRHADTFRALAPTRAASTVEVLLIVEQEPWPFHLCHRGYKEAAQAK